MPPAVARSLPVTASVALLLLTTGGMFGALFVAAFFFQDVLGLDALALLPASLMPKQPVHRARRDMAPAEAG